jgi:hypothetical protein
LNLWVEPIKIIVVVFLRIPLMNDGGYGTIGNFGPPIMSEMDARHTYLIHFVLVYCQPVEQKTTANIK